MADRTDRVPKKYRNKLHRLKNAYRRAYKREPDLEPPVTDKAAEEAIAFLEESLRRAGEPLPPERAPRGSRKPSGS
jgi:hypothetical protein